MKAKHASFHHAVGRTDADLATQQEVRQVCRARLTELANDLEELHGREIGGAVIQTSFTCG